MISLPGWLFDRFPFTSFKNKGKVITPIQIRAQIIILMLNLAYVFTNSSKYTTFGMSYAVFTALSSVYYYAAFNLGMHYSVLWRSPKVIKKLAFGEFLTQKDFAPHFLRHTGTNRVICPFGNAMGLVLPLWGIVKISMLRNDLDENREFAIVNAVVSSLMSLLIFLNPEVVVRVLPFVIIELCFAFFLLHKRSERTLKNVEFTKDLKIYIAFTSLLVVISIYSFIKKI